MYKLYSLVVPDTTPISEFTSFFNLDACCIPEKAVLNSNQFTPESGTLQEPATLLRDSLCDGLCPVYKIDANRYIAWAPYVNLLGMIKISLAVRSHSCAYSPKRSCITLHRRHPFGKVRR